MTKAIWLLSVSYFLLKQLQHRGEKLEFTYIAGSAHIVLKSYGRHKKLVKRRSYRTTQRLIPTTARCNFTSHPSKPAMLILVQFHLQNRKGRTGTNTRDASRFSSVTATRRPHEGDGKMTRISTGSVQTVLYLEKYPSFVPHPGVFNLPIIFRACLHL